MKILKLLGFFLLILLSYSETFSVELTPYSFIFEPQKNRILKEKQKIDFNLTNPKVLKVGPYLLTHDEVKMSMSRERIDFLDIEFGIDIKKKPQVVYVFSFKWPESYIKNGIIELLDDQSEVLWRREVTEKGLLDWRGLLKQAVRPAAQGQAKKQILNPVHFDSNFGIGQDKIYDIPIVDMTEPFRFCISKKNTQGRVSLCSKRYEFKRKYGALELLSLRKVVAPQIRINDKRVKPKGSAVFLDYQTPIKFSAMISDGTYFEFISKPRPVNIDDVTFDDQNNRIQFIGSGYKPMGEVKDDIFADKRMLGFLNFMPTIGKRKKYWSAFADAGTGSLFIEGESGVPFRQGFSYKALPKESYRPTINTNSKSSTYLRKVTLKGRAAKELKLSVPKNIKGSQVRRLESDNFEWDFVASQPGENFGELLLNDGINEWVSRYKLVRTFPGEISLRSSAVVSDSLDLVVLGEVGGQYWFEDIFGLESYYFTQQRWGISARYFDTLVVAAEDPVEQGIVDVSVLEGNLKYRLDPGVWGHDPTVGLILSYQSLSYTFREDSSDITSENPMLGIGAFWARSMPGIFDKLFNILPFFRYPKWVDMEAIYYPVSQDSALTNDFNISFNFHGKVFWTERFFGEGSFGMKLFSYEDPTVNKNIGFGMAYATAGIGYSF